MKKVWAIDMLKILAKYINAIEICNCYRLKLPSVNKHLIEILFKNLHFSFRI